MPIVIRTTAGWKIYEVKFDDQVEGVDLGKLHALPPYGKPVHAWKPTDKGWASIADGIERLVEARNKGSQAAML